MPTNLTEVSQFTANCPVPDDGEDADAASVVQFAQVLADRTQFLRDGLPEYAFVGRRLLYAPGDGTVRVGAIGGVVLGGKLLSLGSETNLGSAARASSAWVYVYCYDNAGTLTLEESATAPTGTMTLKNGDATRRYVGCFRTDSSGVPIPMRYCDGVCTYRRSAVATGGGDKLKTSAASSTSFADVDLSAWVPPTSRLARLRAAVTKSAAIATLQLRTKGDTAGVIEVAGYEYVAGPEVELEVDATYMIQYLVSSGSSTELFAAGFRE